MVRLRGVTKRYPGMERPAVDGVDLETGEGELLVLLGESGCGKTTTLKMINRLIEPTGGVIEVEGADVRAENPVLLRRRIGYVFQGVGLFPHMTVAENVGVTPRLLGWSRDRIRSRTEELLDAVHLPPGEYMGRYPRELSGGQRQRVGVARALACEPRVLLMDEPFGALDPLTRDSLQDEVRGLHKRLNVTVIMVTHDMTEALLLADRIALMKEGRLHRVATPRELMRETEDEYVESMMSTPKRQADRLEALAEGGA